MAGRLLAVPAMQAGLWFLARLVRLPLKRLVVVAGLFLPHLVFAPRFVRKQVACSLGRQYLVS